MTARDRETDRRGGGSGGGDGGGVPPNACGSSTLLVGIGSGHGDDSIGWRVAQAILARWPGRFRVTIPSTPIGLIDQLDGVERLFVCDAFVREDDVDDSQSESAGECETTDVGRCGLVRRWRWPDAAIDQTSFSGTHDLSLVAVLRLAESIRRLPAEVHIIGIGIVVGSEACDLEERRMDAGLSPKLAAVFDRVVGEVMAEIDDA